MKFNQDSALGRSVKTLVQAIVGLFLTVWAVPGVPQAVTNYVNNHVVQVAALVGIPAAVITFVWNLLRKDVPNV